jgi:hypothetical protein
MSVFDSGSYMMLSVLPIKELHYLKMSKNYNLFLSLLSFWMF